MFRRLSYNKQVFETNLYDCLPLNTTGVLQVNKERELQPLLPVFGNVQKIASNIKSVINYPLLLAEQKNSLYLLAKVNEQQEKDLRDRLNTSIFPELPPKEVPYKNVKFLFYTADDNQFFVCTFYAGIFIGGYNTLLLEDFVDIINKAALGIAQTPSGKEIVEKIKSHYPANLFLNNKGSFSVFNITMDDARVKMEGFDTSNMIGKWNCSDNADLPGSYYPFFPNSVVSYKIEMENPLIADSLRCYFSPPSYTIQVKGKSAPLYILKHIDNKFVIYNKLNKLEEGYIKKKFNINDFFAGYRIYTTSKQMGRDIFHFENSAYLVFYKDHLIFSEDKTVLQDYLVNNGKYEFGKLQEILSDDNSAKDIQYSADLRKYYPDFLNPGNPLSRKYYRDAYIFYSPKNNGRDIEVFFNN